MKAPVNTFTQAIRAGTKQVGLWVSLCNNISAEVVAPAGFDWMLIDMEHSPNDLQSVLSQLQVFSSHQIPALIRPPASNDPVIVKRLLDIGTPGLLFPMIESAEDAVLAVAATRYPPRGVRGVGASTRATQFGRRKAYFSSVEAQTTVIVQLESIAALQQADEISKVDGVDGIFFGPADIAADMGLLGQPMHQQVWDAIFAVADRLIENDIAVGTLVGDAKVAADLLNRGFTFVAAGSDTNLLAQASDRLLSDVKDALD